MQHLFCVCIQHTHTHTQHCNSTHTHTISYPQHSCPTVPCTRHKAFAAVVNFWQVIFPSRTLQANSFYHSPGKKVIIILQYVSNSNQMKVKDDRTVSVV